MLFIQTVIDTLSYNDPFSWIFNVITINLLRVHSDSDRRIVLFSCKLIICLIKKLNNIYFPLKLIAYFDLKLNNLLMTGESIDS